MMGNLTQVFKAPMFASMPEYFQCNNIGPAKPKINSLPEAGYIKERFQSYADIEPFSGIVVNGVKNILISLYIEPDDLFIENAQPIFIPVYSLHKEGLMPSKSIEKFFGPLKIALAVSYYSKLGSIIVGAVSILLITLFCILSKKKTDDINPLLKEIINPVRLVSTNSDATNNA